jgi:hypothetical protein
MMSLSLNLKNLENDIIDELKSLGLYTYFKIDWIDPEARAIINPVFLESLSNTDKERVRAVIMKHIGRYYEEAS